MKSPRRTKSPRPSPTPAPLAAREEEVGPSQPNTPNSDAQEHIPPQWTWHYRTLLHLRDRLTRAHSEHAREAANPIEQHGVDPVDTAQERLERDLLWTELANEHDRLFEIDCALQRLRDGVYGYCEETGHAIPAERLRAVPWTRYCRSIVEQQEQARARRSCQAD